MKYDQVAKQEIKSDETLFRAFVCDEIKILDEKKRLIDFVISTEAVDRYGDIIRAKGFDLKAYRKNPVVLFAHNSYIPPIGRAIKVSKEDGALKATAEFMPEDLSEFAFSIFRMYQEKFLRAVSVGFLPTKWETMLDDEGRYLGIEFLKQELLEFSSVPIPANPEALVEARRLGINMTPIRNWAEQVIDEWGDMKPVWASCYGVDRKAMEIIRRKASGVGVTINVPLDAQDKLLADNLERVKEGDDLPVVGEDTSKDDKVSIKDYSDSLVDVWFNALPVVTDIENNVEPIVIRNEDDKVFVDKAPDKSLFTLDLLKASNSDLKETEIEEQHRRDIEIDFSKGVIRLPNGDETLVYEIIGRGVSDDRIVVGVATFEAFDNTVVNDEQNESDDIPAVVEGEIVTLDDDVEADKVSLSDQDAQVEVEDHIELDIDDAETDVKDIVEENQDDDEDLDFGELTGNCLVLETHLSFLEETLDKVVRSGQPFSRAELRRLRFLSQEFSHVMTQIDKITGSENGEDEPAVGDGGNGLTLTQLKDLLSGPEFAERVQTATKKAVEKARGRLD